MTQTWQGRCRNEELQELCYASGTVDGWNNNSMCLMAVAVGAQRLAVV